MTPKSDFGQHLPKRGPMPLATSRPALQGLGKTKEATCPH